MYFEERGHKMRFELRQMNTISTTRFTTLHNQFTKLNLNWVFGVMSVSEISDRGQILTDLHSDGGARAVSRYLQEEARSPLTSGGFNHWKYVLFDSLARDPYFCDLGTW